MDQLELTVFNVGHGLSVMIRELPENYITLIDLGADEKMSPLEYIRGNRLRADHIYISHPHGDHISEIDKLKIPNYRPNTFYAQEYDWKDVASREQPQLRSKINSLQEIKSSIKSAEYSGNARLKRWQYSPSDAKTIFGDAKYVNNSSIAIIYSWKTFKIAILGDLETDALEKYCLFEDFTNEAKGADILIAPHHGHDSGFPELWVNKIGKPYVTLISIKESDPSICKKYQTADFNKGINFNGQTRYTMTTRQDGSIKVLMYYTTDKALWTFSTF